MLSKITKIFDIYFDCEEDLNILDIFEIDSQSVTEFLAIKFFFNTYFPIKLLNIFINIK